MYQGEKGAQGEPGPRGPYGLPVSMGRILSHGGNIVLQNSKISWQQPLCELMYLLVCAENRMKIHEKTDF